MANKIIKTTLHPDLSPQDTDLYPKTSVDMVEGLDTELNNLETKINDIGAPITPFFYNDKLNNNGAINSNLLIPQRELYEGAKIIDQSAQMFQATLNDGNYVANQLTFAEQYNADINNAITEVQNNLTNKSQDLEAKITEVGADYRLADEQVLADAKAYTDSHSGGTKKIYNYFIMLSGQCLLDNTDTGGVSSYLIMNIVTSFNTDITTKNMSTIATILLNALHYSEDVGAKSPYYPANGIFTLGSTPPQYEGDVLAVFMRADDTSIIHFAYKNKSGTSLLNGSLNMNLHNGFIKIEKIEL